MVIDDIKTIDNGFDQIKMTAVNRIDSNSLKKILFKFINRLNGGVNGQNYFFLCNEIEGIIISKLPKDIIIEM